MKIRAGLVCALLIALPVRLHADSPAGRPGREIALPADQVKDSFFAYAIGVIVAGVEVNLDNADLRDILTEFKSSLKLPFDLIDRVRQYPVDDPQGLEFSILFTSSVKIPIPFSFLGYHPGSILASPEIRFTEAKSESFRAPGASPADSVYVLRLNTGLVVVDVDDWLEALLPTIIDDLFVDLFAIFPFEGTWYCLLAGTGRRGEPIREYFDFTHNRIIFPIPGDLAAVGNRIALQYSFAF